MCFYELKIEKIIKELKSHQTRESDKCAEIISKLNLDLIFLNSKGAKWISK